MTKIVLLVFSVSIVSLYGQSKVVSVSKSILTGISLPDGAKQDKRLLQEVAVKTQLEMIAEDNAITLGQSTEIFSLPVAPGNEMEEKIKIAAQRAGWSLVNLPSQTQYWLIQKGNQKFLMYLFTTRKETQLYFSEAFSTQSTPEQTISAPNTNVINPGPPMRNVNEEVDPPTTMNSTPIRSGYAFNTTNFDDGWVSTVQENWVEAAKGSCKALIHYPNKVTSEYNPDAKAERERAWNTFVAPRYSNVQNYFIASNRVTFIEASFSSATMMDNQSGNTVYVALFKRGNSSSIEFVAPDIQSFGQATGFDISKLNESVDSDSWAPLERMAGYNKFAVAATDLSGTWTNNFSGFQQYVNVYTGADAGANTHSSVQTFDFFGGSGYNWSLNVASGFVGNIKFNHVKSSGKYTLPNNWQIQFSDLEGKPKLYNAYFSCIKGARILWLQDISYGGYTSFGKKE